MAYTRHGHHITGSSMSDVGFLKMDANCSDEKICVGCMSDIEFWNFHGTVQLSDVTHVQKMEDRTMPNHRHWVKLPSETEQKLMTCNIPEGACTLSEGSPEEIGFWFDQKIPGSSFTEWATEFRRRKALVEKIKADPKLIEELDRAAGIPTDADKVRFHASDPVMKREVLLFGEINGVRRLIGKATIEQDFSNTVNPTPVVVVELADGSPLGAFLGPSLSNPSKNGLRLVKAKVDEEVSKNMNDAMDAIVDFARQHKLTPEQIKNQIDRMYGEDQS